MSNGLLEKVISTSTIGTGVGGGGLLSPQQSDRFISYIWDATTLGSQVRKVRMRGNEVELDRMSVGERVVRMATEAVDDALAVKVAFAKVSVSTTKLRLDWELSTESLEDNIEGEAFEDHVARLLSAQAANDIEDLAINGDVNNTGPSASLFKAFDGWRKRLYAGANVVDAGGDELDRGVFHRALRAMDRKYMARRGGLRWYTSAGLLQDYVYNAEVVDQTAAPTAYVPQADRDAALRDPLAGSTAGWSPTAPYGIRAQEVPLFPEYDISGPDGQGSDVWLVDPQNLIWGIKREIVVYRQFVPRKDTIEYTMFTRVGCAIENPNAAVLVKNVAYRA
jgi:hypothetical protein